MGNNHPRELRVEPGWGAPTGAPQGGSAADALAARYDAMLVPGGYKEPPPLQAPGDEDENLEALEASEARMAVPTPEDGAPPFPFDNYVFLDHNVASIDGVQISLTEEHVGVLKTILAAIAADLMAETLETWKKAHGLMQPVQQTMEVPKGSTVPVQDVLSVSSVPQTKQSEESSD